MTTESSEAFISYEHQVETFYFCSEHCLKKFKADCDKYNYDVRDKNTNE